MLKTKQVINPNNKEEKTLFIPAFMEDNAFGMERDPGYESRLMSREKRIAEALRYGRWDVFAGQLFPEFGPQHKITPIEIPDDWTRWRSVDWGYAAPWCCLWWARNPLNGHIYVTNELYRAGLTDPAQVRAIKDHSLTTERFAYTFADPSMWERDTKRDVITSTAEVYANGGVPLTKANNDQRNKISKTHAVLAPMYDNIPGVQIFDNCVNLLRTLPALMCDPTNPETIMDGQEEHAWDAFAYGLTNYIPPKRPDEKVNRSKPNNPWNRIKSI